MDFTTAISGNVLYIYTASGWLNNKQYDVIISPGLSGSIPPSGLIDIMMTEYAFWFTGP